MKLFLAWQDFEDSDRVVGVYSTLEKAMEECNRADGATMQWEKKKLPDAWRARTSKFPEATWHYFIAEIELDKTL